MAGNANPIFSRIGNVGTLNATNASAVNDYTGAGAQTKLVFSADATNGSYIERIRFKALGTNIATVARIYLNNGTGSAGSLSAANNIFYGEVSLPATTASSTAATVEIDYLMGFALPAGYKVYVQLATAVAAGWSFNGIGGDY